MKLSVGHFFIRHVSYLHVVLLVIVIALFALNVHGLAASTKKAVPKPTLKTSVMFDVQDRNERAQAEYYELQVRQLRNEQKAKSNWELIGANAAAIAAVVAFFTFYFNYRLTQRNVKNTQFYEALKRFGDPSSPVLRCSATSLLAQMNVEKWYGVHIHRPKGGSHFWSRPYFTTTVDQLLSGLLLEDDPTVITSIGSALKQLIPYEPRWLLRKLYTTNLILQKDFVRNMADFHTTVCDETTMTMDDSHWDHIAQVTEYSRVIIQTMKDRCCDVFRNSIQTSPRNCWRITKGQREQSLERTKQQVEAEYNLWLAAQRIRMNAHLCAAIIRRFDCTGAQLPRIFLAHEDLAESLDAKKRSLIARLYWHSTRRVVTVDKSKYICARLSKADLSEAQLQSVKLWGCDFSRATLRRAELWKAELRYTDFSQSVLLRANLRGAILYQANLTGSKMSNASFNKEDEHDCTDFTQCNWWCADFYREGLHTTIDKRLLKHLYDHWADSMPSNPAEIHPSVLLFAQQREQSASQD